MYRYRGINRMREPLSGLLHSRYRSLYGSRRDPEPWPFHLWRFEHGDGWFGLIDALSAVVACRVAERALAFSITQVKAKLGTLRYYAGGMDEFCRGAKAFAEMMSGRLSERSGRPGLPSRIGRYICTLAPAEGPGAEVWPEFEPTERFIAGCDPTRAVALVRSA